LTDRKESVFTLAQLERHLSNADQTTVLVGGQALVFWVDRYDVSVSPERLAEGISSDADFLGDRLTVSSLADDVRGKASYPSPHAITALMGQVTIPLNDDEFLNVDVIDRIVGIDADAVRKRALEAQLGDVQFQVMHPLDVLQSRIENLAQIADKRTEEGIDQARLSVAVAREYVKAIAAEPDGQRLALKAIEHVVRIGKSGAGRKAAREFGIDFLPAIPFDLIENDDFLTQRWPRIVEELSAASQQTLSLAAFIDAGKYSVKELDQNAGRYDGKFLWTDGQLALQSIGRENVVIHDVRQWPAKPAVDESAMVQYRNGTPSLKVKTPEQDRSGPSSG